MKLCGRKNIKKAAKIVVLFIKQRPSKTLNFFFYKHKWIDIIIK